MLRDLRNGPGFLISPIFLRALFWLSLILITCLALLPLQTPALTEHYADKINHVAAFSLLSVLLRGAYRIPLSKAAWLLLGYGLLIETVQFFIPNRMFSLLDIAADGLGIVLGGLILILIEKFFGTVTANRE